jgi:hypothetical protein
VAPPVASATIAYAAKIAITTGMRADEPRRNTIAATTAPTTTIVIALPARGPPPETGPPTLKPPLRAHRPPGKLDRSRRQQSSGERT